MGPGDKGTFYFSHPYGVGLWGYLSSRPYGEKTAIFCSPKQAPACTELAAIMYSPSALPLFASPSQFPGYARTPSSHLPGRIPIAASLPSAVPSPMLLFYAGKPVPVIVSGCAPSRKDSPNQSPNPSDLMRRWWSKSKNKDLQPFSESKNNNLHQFSKTKNKHL